MANILIKRKNLIIELKKAGIQRINPEFIALLERILKEYMGKIINVSKEEMITHGRKTLKKEDIQKALKKQESAWEI